MSRVLITGGAGFIGSHTSLVLLEKGYDLVILDSLINSSKISIQRLSKIVFKNEKSERINFIKGDIRNKKLLENIFKKATFDNNPFVGVIHFAGLKSVNESINNPIEYWDNNVLGSLNLFRVMDKYNCKTIVFSSSANIYAKSNDNRKLTENSEIRPNNPYGETKAAIEKILFNLSQSCNSQWRIANLRYFNPIGAHFSGLIGEDPKGLPSNIFPFINQVAAKRIEFLNIFGNDWLTPDGTGVRDYIHVMDLAEGHVSALEYLFKKKKVINLNLGTGKATSVFDLINTFKRVNKIDLPYKIKDRRAGDLGFVVADNSLAKSLLKWKPNRSLDEMCKDGWNWQLKNPHGYQE